jgi:hypothetical protein
VAAAACLLLAIAIRMSDLARLASHWLLGPLLPDGRDGGALFLAGAAAAMLASLALARRSGAAWLDRPDAAYLLLATVVFAHGVGLLALLGYQERLELPWQLGSYHWSGDAYLFNSLLHADLGRSALSTLLQALPATAGDAFHAATGDARDGGTLLLAQVPAVERWTIGLLWVAALGAALAAAPAIARRHDWHPVAIGLFMLAALDALQAVVDGGALSLRLAPSLLMLALLACARDTAHLRSLVRNHWLAALAVLAVHAGAWAALSSGESSDTPGGLAGLLPLYALGLLCWAFREQIGTVLRTAALCMGLGFLALQYAADAVSGVGLLLRPLPAQARIVVVDSSGRVARDASEALRGATPLAVYRRFGDDPMRPRRVLIDAEPMDSQREQVSGERPGREFTFALRFIDGRPAAATAREGIYTLLAAERVPDLTNTAVFLFRTASPLIPPFIAATRSELGRNNFHVHLHLVAATLRAQGLQTFVMVPLREPHERDLFLPPRRARTGKD